MLKMIIIDAIQTTSMDVFTVQNEVLKVALEQLTAAATGNEHMTAGLTALHDNFGRMTTQVSKLEATIRRQRDALRE